jgi:hypothetical protein
VYMGRKDDCLKVRGYRIEPVEVEDALRRQPGVDDVVVCAQPRPNDDAQLVAYVILRRGHASTGESLRQALRAELPAYMIPAGFVFLDRFPFTPHGKIDRQQLRQLGPPTAMAAPAAGPTTDAERLLCAIWSGVFGGKTIGRHDNFFDLGGDSLIAARVVARVAAEAHLELNLRAFADHPTLESLAGLIDQLGQTDSADRSPRLVRAPRTTSLPLSYAQERTWKYSQTPEGSAGYAMARNHRILGPLDVEALRESIGCIVRRHEILRTSFAEVDGAPVQVVHPQMDAPLTVFRFAGEADLETRANQLFRSESRRPFDLTQLPLLRFALVRIREDEHWLLRVNHHIISDAWTWKLFLRELGVVYAARRRGEEPTLPETEPPQYGDYAAWQRQALRADGKAYQAAVAWWKDQFGGEPRALEFPFRRPEPLAGVAPAEGIISWEMDVRTAAALDRLGREEGATYYAVRLAAFAAVLVHETAQSDFVLGAYVTNRDRVEMQNMFGFLVNLVTLRLRCDEGRSFCEWLADVRKLVADVQAQAEIPYEQLCEELRKQGLNPPEVRAIFSVTDPTEVVQGGDIELTALERRREVMPWGFTLTFEQYLDRHRCCVEFDAGIYDPEGVRGLLGRFFHFLDAVSSHPHRPLIELHQQRLAA